MSMTPRVVPAGAFKQVCLAILDDVAETHREVVVTKRGKAVARVVPVISDRQREEEILRALRGRARMLVPEEEFLAPLTREAGWRIDEADGA
jgi:prevent-host-death family protein